MNSETGQNGFTYQRKDGIIRVPINAEVLFADGTNYVVYDNVHYGGKWFYCFISKIEFINENMTALHIKTDVFQTWYFEMELKYTFIEREHTITDNLFQHTLPEGLPTGDLVETNRSLVTPSLSARTSQEFDQNYWVLVMTTERIKEVGDYSMGQNLYLGGTPTACYMYAFDLTNFGNLIYNINNGTLEGTGGSGNPYKIDSIVETIAVPKFMVTVNGLTPTPTPPPPSPSTNYLGSPFNASFSITQIYDPSIPHYGQDIVGTDDNVYATYDGVVVDARWQNEYDHNRGYGLLVRIYNAQMGLYFIYGHLNAIYVQQGQEVRAGDCIGLQGWTGNVDPPGERGKHLHYQLSAGSEGWNDDTVNPSNYAHYPNVVGDY